MQHLKEWPESTSTDLKEDAQEIFGEGIENK